MVRLGGDLSVTVARRGGAAWCAFSWVVGEKKTEHVLVQEQGKVISVLKCGNVVLKASW